MKSKITFLSFVLIGVVFLSSGTYNSSNMINTNTKEIGQAEFDSIIKANFTQPISDRMEKQTPSIFMTKCRSYVNYFLHEESTNETGKTEKKYNVLGTYSGSIYFRECNHQSSVCDFRINLSDLKPWARESFFDQWSSLDEFLKKKFN